MPFLAFVKPVFFCLGFVDLRKLLPTETLETYLAVLFR